MLADFCIRLAAGLSAAMALSTHPDVTPGFFRTHSLVSLGLLALAAVTGPADLRVLLGVAAGLAWLGFVQWSLGWSRAGRTTLWVVAGLAALALLGLARVAAPNAATPGMVRAAAVLTSAAVLGSGLTAMLLGHWYLVTPAMAMAPLQRLIRLSLGGLAARAIVTVVGVAVGVGLVGAVPVAEPWSRDGFWWGCVAARWLVGLVAPAALAWMVWRTTQIRATQSATGILYASIILTFFGELLAMVVQQRDGTVL
jgi:hypothetical protein